MSNTNCGCCACLAGAGASPDVANRPGLSSIRYRIGTHSTFLDAMIRRLTMPVDDSQPIANYSLHALTTRESDDASMAMLDAWATVGDVLTFYQERIANEGYLRTATERRSILELGREVGYTLKPGVSASVYLAYTLDETAKAIIPKGTKAQSIPGADEQPQMFEASEDTDARGAWNALRPRMSMPQELTIDNVLTISSVWIEGTNTRIDVRDPLLFLFEEPRGLTKYALRRALKTNVDSEHKRTEVVLEEIRPYYRTLDLEIRKALRNPPAQPAAPVDQPKSKATKAKAAKAANSNEAPEMLFTSSSSILDELHQQVLLGFPRTQLQALFSDHFRRLIVAKATPPVTAVEEALMADDLDQPPDPYQPVPCNPEHFLTPLIKARGLAPASQWQFTRSLQESLSKRSDAVPRLLSTFFPQAGDTIYTALANNTCGDAPYLQFRGVFVLRRNASVFGYNAPTVLFEERSDADVTTTKTTESVVGAKPPFPKFVNEENKVLYLDNPAEAITVGSYVLTQNARGAHVTKVLETGTQPRTAYGISSKSTRLGLSDEWWSVSDKITGDDRQLQQMAANLGWIRSTTVWAESEELTLAQQPADRPIGRKMQRHELTNESEMRIELDVVVDGLAAGRWVIVSGERLDTKGTAGVISAELAMVDNIELQTNSGPGGTAYSILVLAPAGLAYEYKRNTVKIFANVVKADNGNSVSEILGGGDASQSLQTFLIHQKPLTFVSAPTVDGVVSTLTVRVNDVLWHEIETLETAGPSDRIFVTRTDDDGKVRIIFGNGRKGMRLPTGGDNVRTVYRSQIGIGGNCRAGQIATAISRPLGVQNVVNPLPASGGADPESRDDARRNIPVSLQAMGRVVSVQDYADFARTFAGISKASAVALSDGRRRLVHLTIGGSGDIEIDVHSDLYRNLGEALRKYGDPYQPLLVEMREKIVIAGAARVRVDPDYLWIKVAPRIRAALLDTFSYDRREFAQPVYPAEVVATIQKVAGVTYVHLDTLGAIRSSHILQTGTTQIATTEIGATQTGIGQTGTTQTGTMDAVTEETTTSTTDSKIPASLVRFTGVNPIVPRLAHRKKGELFPAGIAYIPSNLADLFILTEIAND
jgi:hypothetical protein